MDEMIIFLLSLGGNKVKCSESVNEQLIKFGHLYNEKSTIKVSGNLSALYIQNKNTIGDKLRIVSGFALTPEGIWENHAWLIIDHYGYKIIDNKKHIKYFGVSQSI